ncbi:MFS transporter [Paenibacillus alkalitolerans]|uniref:MFS transporter n=1 Tax=Paenibacillus alkalitolerans TaxID=2799335 RepID=UPI0018F55D05|nr:MFS transporter [Paenibacillus alkalitolerans]
MSTDPNARLQSNASGTVAGERRVMGWCLALLATAQLIYSLDINIVFVALPEIGRDLGFSEQSLQWVVSAYTIFCGGFLLLGGRAADLLGQKRMFICALFLYAVSSLLGGLAWDTMIIIIARAIQGIGAALLFPATLSLINRLFEEGPRRNRALAVWGGAGASGLTIGSILGGLLTNAFGWEAVFYVNVPLAGAVALAAMLIIPRDEIRHGKRHFDLPGALTVTAGATLLVYVLVQGPEIGWGSLNIIISAILSVALLSIFALIETRTVDPLMSVHLFRNRSLVIGMTVTFIFMGTFGALPYFLTILFQNIHGYSALQTGLAFIIPSLAIATGTQLGERLATRLQTRSTLFIGMIIGIVGTMLIPLGAYTGSSYLIIVPGLIISGIGQGITWTGMWIAASSGVSEEEQGVASGMASTTLNIGNAVGLAVLIAIANSNIQGKTGDSLLEAMASGERTAIYLAALGMLVGLVIALFLPRKR